MCTARVTVFVGYRTKAYRKVCESHTEACAWITAQVNAWRGYEVTTYIIGGNNAS